MSVIDNQPTTNDYATATTIQDVYGCPGITFTVGGTNAYMSAQYGSLGDTYWTEDRPVQASAGLIEKAIGVKFKSYIANVPAFITAIAPGPGEPVVTAQQYTSGGVGGALGVRSATDVQNYLALLTHDRHLLVSQQWQYGYAQYGRLWLHDGFDAAPLNWQQAAGTVVLATSRTVSGAGSLSITSPAGAGAQGIARKWFPLAADQQNGDQFGIHTVISCWFNPSDANWRDFQILARVDDSLNRWLAGVRYFVQNAAVGQFKVQTLNSAGAFVDAGTYQVRGGGGGPGADPWHFFMVNLSYQQTSAPLNPNGYLNYHLVKFDDFTFIPSPELSAQNIGGSSGFRETIVDLIASSDNAGTTAIFVDEFLISDVAATDHLG